MGVGKPAGSLSAVVKTLTADSPEAKFVETADGAQGFKNDGQLSVAERDSAATSPAPDAKVVSSRAVNKFVQSLPSRKVGAADAPAGEPIGNVTTPWQLQL